MTSGIKANRKSVRASVIPEKVQGLITILRSGEQTPFLLWDISETGLGIWTANPFASHAAIRLTFGQPYPLIMDAIVQWCHPDDEGKGFRSGLETETSHEIFTKLYQVFKNEMEKKASSKP